MTKMTIEITNETPSLMIRNDAREGDVLIDFRAPVATDKRVFVTDKPPSNMSYVMMPNKCSYVRPGPYKNSIFKDETVTKVCTFRFVDADASAKKQEDRPAPVMLSCVDPLDKLLSTVVGGRTGAACLEVYEDAQRAEKCKQVTNADSSKSLAVAGLLPQQVVLAQQCWTEKLRKLSRDAADKDRHQVTLDTDADDVLIPVKDPAQ
jgi:hypothetical protein